MKIVFMGSPDFAIPSLRALHSSFTIAGVICQPDRPAGRGRQLKYPPIKEVSLELGLPLHQPERLSSNEAMRTLRQWQPDLIVVAAYGQILPQDVLELPKYGCLNVHASLLPRWRGAAPIQAAILHGDDHTGISIMLMDAGLDTGPIVSQKSIRIQPEETGGELFERLAPLGADLLVDTLPSFISGEIKTHEQDDDAATYAPMLSKRDGLLDFGKAAVELARQVRAFNPWPGSHFFWQGRRHLVHQAKAWDHQISASPGTTTVYDSQPAVACNSGLLILDNLQPAGKNAMSGEEFLNGARDFTASQLTAR